MFVSNINYIRYILLIVVFIQLSCGYAMAIEDVTVQNHSKTKKTVTTQTESPKLVTSINFDKVLEAAREHSYDLKMADFNILISKQDVRAAKSEYWPKLIANAGTEYTKNFRENKEATVMSIADSFINPYTRFQSVIGINLTYNLFDFGIRRGRLNIAKEDVTLKELEEEKQWQDLKLNLVDTYCKLLVIKKQIDIYSQMLPIAEKNLNYKERLFKAKEISKMEVNTQAVDLDTIKNRLSELNSMYAENLEWLSFYTGESYDKDKLQIADFKKSNFDVNAFKDYTKSITWLIYEQQIKKKELELSVVKKTNYPKINAYSRYYFYGSDKNNFGTSLSDFGPSNFSVGASMNMMLFDGMKNRANIQKTYLELQKLNVERDKAIAQFMSRLAVMRTNLIYLNEQVANNEDIVAQLTDKEKSFHRLVSKRLSSPIEENDAKIEMLKQKIELEKNKTTSAAITKGIEILTNY